MFEATGLIIKNFINYPMSRIDSDYFRYLFTYPGRHLSCPEKKEQSGRTVTELQR